MEDACLLGLGGERARFLSRLCLYGLSVTWEGVIPQSGVTQAHEEGDRPVVLEKVKKERGPSRCSK